MFMKLLDNIISSSERETLLYKNLQHLKYKLGKLTNFGQSLNVKAKLRREFSHSASGNLKIQFGAGSGHFGEAAATEIDGFVDSDIFGPIPIDVTRPLPISNGTIHTIFSSHLIEHLHQIEIVKFLNEAHRTLTKGGQFIVATPSLEKVTALVYGDNEEAKAEYFALHGQSLLGRKPTPARVLNCLCHINYGHKFVMDFETFDDLCNAAGFKDTEAVSVSDLNDAGLRAYLEAKPTHYWLETEVWVATK